MAFKDTIKNLFNYFEVEQTDEVAEENEAYAMPNDRPALRVTPSTPSNSNEKVIRTESRREHRQEGRPEMHIQRTLDKHVDTRVERSESDVLKSTIDIKFPKKYEDAPEMVNLLIDNASILIDFQYMSEQQARRCLDYLDGARSVLSGNLKKVSSTMWLLTPVNVTVNIEELRNGNNGGQSESGFDFDMKR
ncbi:TPA: cell division protein SepF [Streptococcus suis]|nr:cell division protein SepF [Streptococcus suis]